jgi:hypothetical protein
MPRLLSHVGETMSNARFLAACNMGFERWKVFDAPSAVARGRI